MAASMAGTDGFENKEFGKQDVMCFVLAGQENSSTRVTACCSKRKN